MKSNMKPIFNRRSLQKQNEPGACLKKPEEAWKNRNNPEQPGTTKRKKIQERLYRQKKSKTEI